LTERLTSFLLQWDHLRDETPGGVTAAAYAARWKVSLATAYRLLEEYRAVLPTEEDPNRLLDLLWNGLSERYLGPTHLGSLLEVKIMRTTTTTPDLRDLLPAITTARLEVSIAVPGRSEGLAVGTSYEAYESNSDRFAWAALPEPQAGGSAGYASFILEGDADDSWLPGPSSPREHATRDDAEVSCAADWARSEGMVLQRLTVSLPSMTSRIAPGARVPFRTRDWGPNSLEDAEEDR
jgi:hypothetical protein